MPRPGWKLFFDSWFFHEHMDTWLSIFSTFLDVDKRYNKKQIHEWMMGYGFYEKQGCDCVFTSIVHHGWWKVLDGGGSGGQTGVAKEECVHSSGPVGKKIKTVCSGMNKSITLPLATRNPISKWQGRQVPEKVILKMFMVLKIVRAQQHHFVNGIL